MDSNIQQILAGFQKTINGLLTRRVGKKDIIPGSISQGHMASGNAVVVYDLAKNRPTVGTNTCIAFFATDTFVFSIWTGTLWKAVTLS